MPADGVSHDTTAARSVDRRADADPGAFGALYGRAAIVNVAVTVGEPVAKSVIDTDTRPVVFCPKSRVNVEDAE